MIHVNQTLFNIENTNEIHFQNVNCVNELFDFSGHIPLAIGDGNKDFIHFL